MKRIVIATQVLALALVIWLPGCRHEELTFEQYEAVWVQLGITPISNPDNPSLMKIQRLPKVCQELIIYSSAGYIDKPWAKWLGRCIHNQFLRMACDSVGVSMRAFNQAHKRFGREGLTYTEEVAEYLEVNPHYVKLYGGNLFSPGTKWLVPCIESATGPLGGKLDREKAERAAELAFDLGIVPHQARILIDIDVAGKVKIRNTDWRRNRKLIRYTEEANKILTEDPYFLVHIIPNSQTPLGSVFLVIQSLPEFNRLIISNKFTANVVVKMWPMFDYDKEIYRSLLASSLDLTVFIEIDGAGNVYLNSKLVDSETSFEARLRKLLDKSRSKFVLVSVNRNAPCGVLVKYVDFLSDAGKIAVVPADVIEGKRPRLSI